MGYGGCTGPNTLRFCGAAHRRTVHSHEGDYFPVWCLSFGSGFMVRCSRRTRAKFCTKNTVQKNYSRGVSLGRLAKNKQKNFSKVCRPPRSSHHLFTFISTFRSRVVKFALAGSELSSRSIPLILVCAYPPSLRHPLLPSSLTLGSFSSPLGYLPCLLYPVRTHVMPPASLLMLYLLSLVFRRLALTLLISRCWKPLPNSIALLMGPARGYCVTIGLHTTLVVMQS